MRKTTRVPTRPDLNRRRFCAAAAATVAARPLGLLGFGEKGNAMTVGSNYVSGATSAQTNGDASIRPFKFEASDGALADLRRRIAATNWPERQTVADNAQGVPIATMQKLARYWSTDYSWRKAETKLNSYPQFTTSIVGLDIHFIHVRSQQPKALPVIITHGWPGSIMEQLKISELRIGRRSSMPRRHSATRHSGQSTTSTRPACGQVAL